MQQHIMEREMVEEIAILDFLQSQQRALWNTLVLSVSGSLPTYLLFFLQNFHQNIPLPR